MPRTLGRFGLTGKTVPPKGFEIRFQRIVRPTLPSRSLAPITATVSGANMASNGCGVSAWRRSYDGSFCGAGCAAVSVGCIGSSEVKVRVGGRLH